MAIGSCADAISQQTVKCTAADSSGAGNCDLPVRGRVPPGGQDAFPPTVAGGSVAQAFAHIDVIRDL